MIERSVTVYLDTGATREHVLAPEDDADYVKKINDCVDALSGNPRGILGFTTPLYFYKVENIIAIEFLDPPSQKDKIPIGYRCPAESSLSSKF